jgi:hypothetical protein
MSEPQTVQQRVASTSADRASNAIGGARRPGAYIALVVLIVLTGRMWRLLPGLAPAPPVTS